MASGDKVEFEFVADPSGFVQGVEEARKAGADWTGDLSSGLAAVSTALGALSGAIGLVALAVAGSTAAVVALIALGVPVLIAATVLAVGGLVLAIKEIGEALYNNVPAVKEFADSMSPKFTEISTKIKAGWQGLGKWFESSGMKEFLVGVWEDANGALGRFFKFARPLWDEFLGWLSSGLDKIGACKVRRIQKSGNGMKPWSSQKAQIWGVVSGPLCSLRALWDGVRVRLGGALAALEGRLLSSERQRQGFLKTVLPAAFFMMMRGLPLWRPAPTVAFPSVRARTIASCSVRLSIIPWSRPPALMATWASSVPSIDRERSIFCCRP